MYRSEILSPQNYAGCAEEVDRLQAHCLQPNIFADPACVQAAQAADPQSSIHVAVVWREIQGRRDLVGAWPVRVHGMMAQARLHDYMMLAAPLIHASYIAEAWRHLLSALNTLKIFSVHCPFMPAAMLKGLQAALAGQQPSVLDRMQRAYLTKNGGGKKLSRKARRGLNKQSRDMAGEGEVSYRRLEGAEAHRNLETFLALERAGWKGRRGTAIAERAQDKTFIAETLRHLNARKFFIASLMLDAKPVSMGLVFRIGGALWFLKMAYDETAARFSPGVQLSYRLSEDVLNDDDFVELDACAPLGLGRHAAPFHEAREFVDFLIPLERGQGFRFRWLAWSMKLRLRLRKGAKMLVKKLMR